MSSTQSDVAEVVHGYIDKLNAELWELNQQIHGDPEIAFAEFHAHARISGFLEGQQKTVRRNAYGLATSFESWAGDGGRCANFSAEYDALPGIGHACGHNLIAVAAIASYLALSHALQHFSVTGRAHLLGTPAEEDGGGKVILVERGAYEKADVSLMLHPMPEEQPGAEDYVGIAGQSSNANLDVVAEFKGKSAHAAASPWDGVNALDAVVAAYNNTSLLRQQMKPEERVHSAILQAPKITNAIPEYTQVKYSLRSPSMLGLRYLEGKVRRCIEAAGLATGCEVDITLDVPYADIKVNRNLSERFSTEMNHRNLPIMPVTDVRMAGSTDMGNVSHVVPGLHATVGIPSSDNAFPHTQSFAAAAGSHESYLRILEAAKAMTMTAWAALTDDDFYTNVRADFVQSSDAQYKTMQSGIRNGTYQRH